MNTKISFAPKDLVRHRNGEYYRIVGRCILEATLEDCYAYRNKKGQLWIRPAKEMEDGRFSLIKPLPFICKFCGASSWIDPADQEPPPDYCHESDHGSQVDYEDDKAFE